MSASRQIGHLGQPLRTSLLVSRSRLSAVSSIRASTCDGSWRTTHLRYTPQSKNYSSNPARYRLSKEKFLTIPEYQTDERFARRHIGPDDHSAEQMLKELDPPVESLDEFVTQVIPPDILSTRKLFEASTAESDLVEVKVMTRSGHSESAMMNIASSMASLNKPTKSFIGTGYYGTITPQVIKRNILENPAWYTSYTPYQPEISQGRLESLLNFQTMVSDLTGLPISNASLLDEGTAAAEAMTLSLNALPSSRARRPGRTFVISNMLHPQTKAVIRSRAEGLGISVMVLANIEKNIDKIELLGDDLIGVMVQYPDTLGGVNDFRELANAVHKQGALLSAATDLLALTYLTPPGEWGADIALGNSQRFGVPLGFGGPHAAFFAVQDKHKRKMPGRLIGVSKDRLGRRALRLSLQTREQHIRREKATSNVCTAQALLANMSAFYAIYHGPEGLRQIAEKVNLGARVLRRAAEYYGWQTWRSTALFDTVGIYCTDMSGAFVNSSRRKNLNIRWYNRDLVSISVDESTDASHLLSMIKVFREMAVDSEQLPEDAVMYPEELLQKCMQEEKEKGVDLPEFAQRKSKYLSHPVFNSHRSETEVLRYMYHLQSKDLSLVHSMIPLGSCTMKLNGSAEMALISLRRFADIHPHVPPEDCLGYKALIEDLEAQLADITAMDAVSLQPNSGAQGEFAGLLAIRRYHKSRGQKKRDICLIPVSAHGTNPASAAMAGMRVVPVKCDTKTGNLDLDDLRAKCEQYADQLGAMMITYPSTYGVFEPEIKQVCRIVHEFGGQVYMDGANMNAQIGLCSPGEIGADVCHLNLHKTFCIPHGGGGPGVGPICVKEHLKEFLPTTLTFAKESPNPPVSSASYGSASILPISWAYNALMGGEGLEKATKITLLNANYLLSKLKPHYSILYTNKHGRCAHEFILDARPFHNSAGIEAIDIAKRLQDYGFHAPTMSWPVPNTLMIEPTESESKEELDRFVEALVSIREEIREIEEGRAPREGNVLKMAPHPLVDIIGGDGDGGAKWDRPYTREKAAYPLPWLKEKKFWPSAARVDDTYGDLNLFCTCPPVEDTTGGHMSSVQED
ncbi:glycine cleavage system P-protein-domain-containing protein [Echria macrotheca]|uniref:Glycine cleavage system P protein n=1 Tax=Echria macrotheca TaxID=438768 RepID=A0AAJ0BJP0_9PEZI|nr:glycine cleavage system P-protein-domain-containing protein [Echria macrotheca]